MKQRPRRNRATGTIRRMVQQAEVRPSNLVWPVFVEDGSKRRTAIPSMPDVCRYSVDELVIDAEKALEAGVPAVALFPALEESLKDPTGSESVNPKGLLQRAVRELKKRLPELLVITDVALDPYSSDGHDGVVRDGKILNDETLPILAKMAVSQAEAGADVVAPSDMMDGRVGAIREALDGAGFPNVLICSYCAKYASGFYGPFRDALDSAPKQGIAKRDRKSTRLNSSHAD